MLTGNEPKGDAFSGDAAQHSRDVSAVMPEAARGTFDMRRSASLVLLAALLTASSAIAGATGGKTVTMPFADCEAIIAEIATEMEVEPVVLASDADSRTIRVDAADGSVTVSCDGRAGTMSLSKTASAVIASR